MNKRPELVAQTKENIRQAFWALYKHKRMERISITEISRTAGYNRTTFYKYYTDIYDVLNNLEDTLLEGFKEQILINFQSDESESDFVRLLSSLYQKNGTYLGILLSEKGDPLFVTKIKNIMAPLLIRSFALDENDPQTEYILEFGISAIIGTLTRWYNNGMSLPSDELAALLRAMLIAAVNPNLPGQ
jgi:AcrR family transcriptional regulator